MCYPSPAPRCSAHAGEKLAKAQSDYRAAVQGHGDPLTASMTLQAARDDFYTTPKGIAQLKTEARFTDAEHYTKLRKQMIDAWRATRIDVASNPSAPLVELSRFVADTRNPYAAREAAVKNLHKRHPAWSVFTLEEAKGQLLQKGAA